MRLSIAVALDDGKQNPKVQIWRKNKTGSDLYFKPGPDILITDPSCNEDFMNVLQEGIFQCMLLETAKVSVQPGDILGLEVPPTDDDNYQVLFKENDEIQSGMMYTFERKLHSSVNLSEADMIMNHQPQISILVTFGKHTIITHYIHDGLGPKFEKFLYNLYT